MRVFASLAAAATLAVASIASSHATVLLYSQNFENPVGYANNGQDVSVQTVNSLYANQPPEFVFSQQFTVETLRVGNGLAYGVGYQDPQNKAGNYVLGMLSSTQDDRLGLAFNVGSFDFLNFQFDLSSIDLNCCGGPFVPSGVVPTARISLYDNPGGGAGLGGGAPLDTIDVTGLAGPNKSTFNWSNHIVGLDAENSTNGNVIMSIDLLTGGYAALDNFVIAASNTAGDVGAVPEPGSAALVLLALCAATVAGRRSKRTIWPVH